jgi:hypothetical protein
MRQPACRYSRSRAALAAQLSAKVVSRTELSNLTQRKTDPRPVSSVRTYRAIAADVGICDGTIGHAQLRRNTCASSASKTITARPVYDYAVEEFGCVLLVLLAIILPAAVYVKSRLAEEEVARVRARDRA